MRIIRHGLIVLVYSDASLMAGLPRFARKDG
jgi:hypothetical protein